MFGAARRLPRPVLLILVFGIFLVIVGVIDGEVKAVVGVWRDAVPILRELDQLRRNVALVTLTAGIIAGIVLFFVFRSTSARLRRQTAALVDAISRDPLTGTLNQSWPRPPAPWPGCPS